MADATYDNSENLLDFGHIDVLYSAEETLGGLNTGDVGNILASNNTKTQQESYEQEPWFNWLLEKDDEKSLRNQGDVYVNTSKQTTSHDSNGLDGDMTYLSLLSSDRNRSDDIIMSETNLNFPKTFHEYSNWTEVCISENNLHGFRSGPELIKNSFQLNMSTHQSFHNAASVWSVYEEDQYEDSYSKDVTSHDKSHLQSEEILSEANDPFSCTQGYSRSKPTQDDSYHLYKAENYPVVNESEVAWSMESVHDIQLVDIKWDTNDPILTKVDEPNQKTLEKRSTLHLRKHMDVDLGSVLTQKVSEILSNIFQVTSDAIFQAAVNLKHNTWVANTTGCATESALFAAERARYISEVTASFLMGDDPEIIHLNNIRRALDGGDWKDAFTLLSKYSTLSLNQRQLIEEKSSSDSHCEDLTRESLTSNAESLTHVNDQKHLLSLIEIAGNNRTSSGNYLAGSIVSANSNDTDISLDASEEAAYALTKIFTPPTFVEASYCFKCERRFGFSLLRHHCRNCGKSFCNQHSSQRRRILHRAITVAVRVCDQCADGIDNVTQNDELSWKLMRVRDYLKGELKPYKPPQIDRNIDKIFRYIKSSLFDVETRGCLSQID